MKITRHLTEINGQYWHYRMSGNGPIVFLIHASPRNSAMFLPLISKLSPYFTVVAPDTPGYGLSDGLPQNPEILADYLPYFKSFFEYIAQDSDYSIYGTATGAQLVIAYSYTFPTKVTHLFLDNAAHFEDTERNEILKHYFIDITPKADGSHFMNLWQMTQRFFNYFPWFKDDEAHRVSSAEIPVSILHASAMEFLVAGANYDAAYKAAFLHEKHEKLSKVKLPTTLFRWKGAILLKYIDDLIAKGLPKNIVVVETEAAIEARYESVATQMRAVLM